VSRVMIQDEVSLGSFCRIQVGVIKHNTFRILLIGKVHKLLLISDIFQRDQIMATQRNISTVASLMKQIFRNQNYADISVMAASCKQVTRLLTISDVHRIV